MIRLAYNDARKLLVILASLRDANDEEMRMVRQHAAEMVPEVAIYAEEPIYSEDIKAIMKQVDNQLSQPEDGSEGMLLDELIRVLQSSYGRGALSRNILLALQNVALTQGEMAALAAKLREGRMACVQCGVELEYGELLIAAAAPGGAHETRCLKCFLPTIVRCSFADPDSGAPCRHPVRISKKLAAAIHNIRHYCEDHEDGKKKKEADAPTPEPTPPPEVQGMRDVDRIFFTPPQNLQGHPIQGLGAPIETPRVANWRTRIRNIEDELRQRGVLHPAADEGVAQGQEDFDDLYEEE